MGRHKAWTVPSVGEFIPGTGYYSVQCETYLETCCANLQNTRKLLDENSWEAVSKGIDSIITEIEQVKTHFQTRKVDETSIKKELLFSRLLDSLIKEDLTTYLCPTWEIITDNIPPRKEKLDSEGFKRGEFLLEDALETVDSSKEPFYALIRLLTLYCSHIERIHKTSWLHSRVVSNSLTGSDHCQPLLDLNSKIVSFLIEVTIPALLDAISKECSAALTSVEEDEDKRALILVLVQSKQSLVDIQVRRKFPCGANTTWKDLINEFDSKAIKCLGATMEELVENTDFTEPNIPREELSPIYTLRRSQINVAVLWNPVAGGHQVPARHPEQPSRVTAIISQMKYSNTHFAKLSGYTELQYQAEDAKPDPYHLNDVVGGAGWRPQSLGNVAVIKYMLQGKDHVRSHLETNFGPEVLFCTHSHRYLSRLWYARSLLASEDVKDPSAILNPSTTPNDIIRLFDFDEEVNSDDELEKEFPCMCCCCGDTGSDVEDFESPFRHAPAKRIITLDGNDSDSGDETGSTGNAKKRKSKPKPKVPKKKKILRNVQEALKEKDNETIADFIYPIYLTDKKKDPNSGHYYVSRDQIMSVMDILGLDESQLPEVMGATRKAVSYYWSEVRRRQDGKLLPTYVEPFRLKLLNWVKARGAVFQEHPVDPSVIAEKKAKHMTQAIPQPEELSSPESGDEISPKRTRHESDAMEVDTSTVKSEVSGEQDVASEPNDNNVPKIEPMENSTIKKEPKDDSPVKVETLMFTPKSAIKTEGNAFGTEFSGNDPSIETKDETPAKLAIDVKPIIKSVDPALEKLKFDLEKAMNQTGVDSTKLSEILRIPGRAVRELLSGNYDIKDVEVAKRIKSWTDRSTHIKTVAETCNSNIRRIIFTRPGNQTPFVQECVGEEDVKQLYCAIFKTETGLDPKTNYIDYFAAAIGVSTARVRFYFAEVSRCAKRNQPIPEYVRKIGEHIVEWVKEKSPKLETGVQPPKPGTQSPVNVSSTVSSKSQPQDTFISNHSLDVAIESLEIVCSAIDLIQMNDQVVRKAKKKMTKQGTTSAFCVIRPPGHHVGVCGKTHNCGSHGFCLLNNVGVGIAHARIKWGIQRVAVVDIDAHYGNGTSDMLINDPNALFASVHLQFRETPGTQSFFASDLAGASLVCPTRKYYSIGIHPYRRKARPRVGRVKSAERTRRSSSGRISYRPGGDEFEYFPEEDANAEVVDRRCECDDCVAANTVYPKATEKVFEGGVGHCEAIEQIIVPALEKFEPEMIFISAGFDGHWKDPLGGQLGMDESLFHRETAAIVKFAQQSKSCRGRIVSVLEGGYDVVNKIRKRGPHRGSAGALTDSAIAHLCAMAGKPYNE